MPGLLIQLFDDELREIPGLEFVARLTLAPAHVPAVDDRGVITKTDRGFVFALIDFGNEAHQVTSRRVIVAVPVGIFVAGKFLWRRRSCAIVRGSWNHRVRRMPTGV